MSIEQLQQEYMDVLHSQVFAETQDRSRIETHRPVLEQLASLKSSAVTVFDLAQKKHVFFSSNLFEVLGYDLELVKTQDVAYFNARIHPEDFPVLLKNGTALFRFLLGLPVDHRKDFKLQNEFRIRNAGDEYVRVIEQHTVLELDERGNVWLALSVMDLSPNQEGTQVRSQLLNVKKGGIISLDFLQPDRPDFLTDREQQILFQVKKGLLSKEISNALAISVHTVNTHRQKILRKLGANNSAEAIEKASSLGLM